MTNRSASKIFQDKGVTLSRKGDKVTIACDDGDDALKILTFMEKLVSSHKWTTERPTDSGYYWVKDKDGHVFVVESYEGEIGVGDWTEKAEPPGYLVAFAGPLQMPAH